LHKLLRLVLQVGHQTPFFKSGHKKRYIALIQIVKVRLNKR